jgi:hypothetical protein
VVSRFVRKVRTSSGAVAAQIVTRRGRQVEQVEHLGSAHSDAELALLLSTAPERLASGLDVLDLGDLASVAPRIDSLADWTADRRAGTGQSTLEAALTAATPKETTGGRPLTVHAGGRVVGTSSLLLWRVLTDAYRRLGFDALADEAFRAIVLAQIVEPTSEADSLRVLADLGAPAPGLRTLFRSLKRCRDKVLGDEQRRLGAHRLPAPGGTPPPQVQERLAALFGVTDGWPCHSRPVGWSSP